MLDQMLQRARTFVFKSLDNKVYHDYFDVEWYLGTNQEVRLQLQKRFREKLDFNVALGHYLSRGWKMGLSPNPYFDTQWYIDTYHEALSSGREPLRHYLETGWRQGCSPSIYFDVNWYLKENEDVACAGIEPLQHYLHYGSREGRDPNPFFSVLWYRRRVEPSILRSREPLRHYLEEGWRLGLSPGPSFNAPDYLKRHSDCREADLEPLKHFLLAGGARSSVTPTLTSYVQNAGTTRPSALRRESATSFPRQAQYFALSPVPLVSIIIPNFNGAVHLRDLFESLRAQTYKNFEIVFVDDCSSDDSVEVAKSHGVDRLVRTPRNVGFAHANNLALPHCSGELIALLNNDMRVDANWLENLVSALKRDPLIAAAAPKIRFWTKFQRVTIRGAIEFALDENALLESLEYKKFFAPHGYSGKGWLRSASLADGETMTLHIPLQSQAIALHLRTEASQDILIAGGGGRARSTRLSPGPSVHTLQFSRADLREGYFLINNAGSALDLNLNPFDRGFGHIDDGELDHFEELDLFCGGAVLIRRDALHNRKLFISELCAYYEDSELSLWLRDHGYKIVYCPLAIAYHKHAASTVEKSAFWLTQTGRNKIIFDYLVAEPSAKSEVIKNGKLHLNHLRHWYTSQPDTGAEELKYAEQIPLLYSQIDEIVTLIDKDEAARSNSPRIGIYNPYWSTLGGGEAHALDIAAALTQFGQVELISESSFDVEALPKYFGHGPLNVRKRLISEFCSDVTRDYDIFVNSCFLNETPSLAKKSYFVVSFPSRRPPEEFTRSYYFLANSAYTLSWMRKFWGESSFQGEVFNPSVPWAFFVEPKDKEKLKKPLILSVGRFVSTGHTKNQLEIVEAFRKFVTSAPDIAKGWTLVLAGTVNDASYLSEVRAASDGLDVVLATEASFDDLRRFYREASIYVHASGYGRDLETQPELLEHFGISVAQALASGCLPLVFDAGGPKDIVSSTGVGALWRTLDELAAAMRESAGLISSECGSDVTERAIRAAARFSAARLTSRMIKLVSYGS